MNDNNKTKSSTNERQQQDACTDGRIGHVSSPDSPDSSQSHRIYVVFNVYRETSIKHAERCNQGSSTAIQYRNIAGSHNIQQWSKFLCSSCNNKSSLIKFILEQWKLQTYREKLHDKSLYVTCEGVCYKMTKNDWVEVT